MSRHSSEARLFVHMAVATKIERDPAIAHRQGGLNVDASKKAALILNEPRRMGHSKWAILSAAFSDHQVHREARITEAETIGRLFQFDQFLLLRPT